jgi:hypothetical protein
MVNTINLCEDEDGPQTSNALRGNQSCHSPQPSTPTIIQPILHNPSEVAPGHPVSDEPTAPSPVPDSRALQHRAYPEAFYIDFMTTMEHTFPWQSFATRHQVSYSDLRHMFFVLVVLPLSDPDDNSKRLKVAQGARKRFGEWRQAWEETVTNVRAQCLDREDTKDQKCSFRHVRAEKEVPLASRKRRLSCGVERKKE